MKRFLALAFAGLAACGTAKPGGMSGPTINNKIGGDTLAPVVSPVVSQDLLAREPVANSARVKHILIGWHALAENYGGQMDPRAEPRQKKDAEAVVADLTKRLDAGEPFDDLMAEYSEDTGSAQSGKAIPVAPDAQLVIEFKQLSLRLQVGERGVCESSYGFHIITRVE